MRRWDRTTRSSAPVWSPVACRASTTWAGARHAPSATCSAASRPRPCACPTSCVRSTGRLAAGVITAHDAPGMADRAVRFGAAVYLAKPFPGSVAGGHRTRVCVDEAIVIRTMNKPEMRFHAADDGVIIGKTRFAYKEELRMNREPATASRPSCLKVSSRCRHSSTRRPPSRRRLLWPAVVPHAVVTPVLALALNRERAARKIGR